MSTPRRRKILYVLPILAAIAVLAVFLLPRQYTARAWIQILESKPVFVYSEARHRADVITCEILADTMFDLMRSPLILDKVLENPEISGLPLVRKQEDPARWITRKLTMKRHGKSEMVAVSFTSGDPETSQRIVNTVVGAFFDYHEAQANHWNARLVTQLTLELNRQQSASRLLKDEIRQQIEAKAKQADLSRTETILKEIGATETKLEELRAEIKARREMHENISERIPKNILTRWIAENPQMNALQTKRAELQEQIQKMQETLVLEDDPKFLEPRNKIRELDKQIELLRTRLVDEAQYVFLKKNAEEMEQGIFEKEIEIRTREIRLENLRNSYKEEIRLAGDRTVRIIDVSFQEKQLERIDGVIDLLQNRITAIQTEMNAPSQIQLRRKATVPKRPDSRLDFLRRN